jgi:hypothetical protein
VLIEEAKHEPNPTPPPANSTVQNNDVTPVKPEERVEKKAAPPIVPAVIPAPAAKKKPALIAEESGDLLAKDPSAVPSAALKPEIKPEVKAEIKPEVEPELKAMPRPSPLALPEPAPAAAVSAPLAAPAAPKLEAEATAPGVQADLGPEPAKPVVKNIVYRGRIETADFDISIPPIREKISVLGGEVIGAGELGAQRKKGEAYFHFSLPESKQQELEDYLKNFGPVRFDKQADKRVMPDGQIHIILTVKDVSPHEEREKTETP